MRDAPCLCIYIFTFFFWGLSRLSKCLKRCFLTFPLPPHRFIALNLHSRHELIRMSFKSGQQR